ncbi:hypothetical protein, conserved [Plasmodium gonderi]|uniref:Protein BCP1 n=1 Tax=Plasmodium gonderi TaxID=77519 RepID=A0A1Y1JQH4_PLAGO|nr:hypothetical protein, conserved [Plasmodium gonderi]GAW82324.1 hypothetical protein, conserved [Plasmodium gonderi]
MEKEERKKNSCDENTHAEAKNDKKGNILDVKRESRKGRNNGSTKESKGNKGLREVKKLDKGKKKKKKKEHKQWRKAEEKLKKKKNLNKSKKANRGGNKGTNEKTENSEDERDSRKDELVVDFELIDPSDTYKDNVRILLRSTELYNNLKCSEQLINVICDQQNIGKFLSLPGRSNSDSSGNNLNSESDNVVGFQTIINLNQYDEIKELKEFLTNKMKKGNTLDFQENIKEITKLIMSDKTGNIGLYISNRIINTPIKLVPLIYKNVIDDVYWSQGIEDLDESEKKFYFFDYILFYTKVYKNLGEEIIFANYEEQYFFQHKIYHVMWNNNNIKKFYEFCNNKNKEVTYKEFVTIFIVPFNKVDEAVKQMIQEGY